MKSVKNNENTIIIKNSRFICLLYQVDRKEEIDNILEATRLKYNDATHCCYAYVLDGLKKESDDGEPSGTAGIPMLQVLEKNDLNHVLCIVVRYFGKIKLGAGGLVRAYTKSVTEALKNHVVILNEGVCATIMFSYDNLKNIDYFLKDKLIIKKEFNDIIKYIVHISLDDLERLKNLSNVEVIVNYSIYLSRE